MIHARASAIVETITRFVILTPIPFSPFTLCCFAAVKYVMLLLFRTMCELFSLSHINLCAYNRNMPEYPKATRPRLTCVEKKLTKKNLIAVQLRIVHRHTVRPLFRTTARCFRCEQTLEISSARRRNFAVYSGSESLSPSFPT